MVLAFALLAAAPASAQIDVSSAPAAGGPQRFLTVLYAAGCQVVARINPPRESPRRRLVVDGSAVPAHFSDPDASGLFEASVQAPFRPGTRIVLEYANASVEATVTVLNDIGCPIDDAHLAYDERDGLETPFFVGAAFEQFAPGFSDAEQHAGAARALAGVNGQYRLFRRGRRLWIGQVWISGGYHAGLRSYCSDEAPHTVGDDVVCQPTSAGNIAATTPIIREATSFEANIAVRVELLALNRDSRFPAHVYLIARDTRFGLDRATASKFADPVFAVGFVVVGGPMRGTSLQGGLGWSKFYAPEGRGRALDRFKVDFTLMAGAKKSLKERLTFWDRTRESFRYFFAVRSDFDAGPGADSIRVATGLAFSPSVFFRVAGGGS
jgi:hypothetical protein